MSPPIEEKAGRSDAAAPSSPPREGRAFGEVLGRSKRGETSSEGRRDGERGQAVPGGGPATEAAMGPFAMPFFLEPASRGTPPAPPAASAPVEAAKAAAPAPTQVDQMLEAVATDVRLASDGAGRTMLRFEVAEGQLRGAQISVTSDQGVVSAVVTAPDPAAAVALERALEAMRASLEVRGIGVAELEVRPDHDRRGGRPAPGSGEEAEPALQGVAPPRAGARSVATASDGIDYFV